MGLGILEARNLSQDHVPGTVFVGGEDQVPDGERIAGVKYDLTGPTPIVLVPQPSDNPNDPLNWPLWRRDLITLLLCLVSVMAATLGPLLAANTLTLALFWERPFTEVALLTGWHLCGVGFAGVFFVPSARVWGKRHLFLLGTLLLVVSSAWGGAASTYQSLLWARIVQGVSVCPFEALVNAAVGDLYCVHQRGKRMAITNFALFGGAFLTPVIVGKMTSTIGWRWTFYFVAIFSGILLPLVFLFVPETAFRRAHHLNTDITSQDNLVYPQNDSARPKSDESSTELQNRKEAHPTPERKSLGASEQEYQDGRQRKVSLQRSLALFSGRKTDDSVFKLALRPFVLLIHPAIFWAMLIQGTLIGWTVMIGVVLGVIFGLPPLWFTEVETGYLYAGAFIGAMFGFLLAGPLADWSARFLARCNNGVYEPEFRLVLVIPQAIVGVVGLFGFGITAANVGKYRWFWPAFFFGLEVMGMVLGAVASALYLVDGYRDIAIEALTCLLLFKNFFSFGLTWKAYDWINEIGVWSLFWRIGIVQIFVCLLTIPMYIFGKKIRLFMHQHDILKSTHLR